MGKGFHDRAPCPIPTCGIRITQRYGMHRHFGFKHKMAVVHFSGEGPLVPCSKCRMQVPSLEIHEDSKLCQRMAERALRRQQLQTNLQADHTVFHIGDTDIESVSSFKYLGQVLSANDDNLPAVLSNIQKAQQRWGQVAQLLVHEGASVKTMGYFYKAIVQAVLLYGSATWVVTERLSQVLDSFYHRCAWFIARDFICQCPNGTWITPSSKSVLEKCSLFPNLLM